MRRRTEFEKDMRHTPSSPSPRFSRTFDLLLSQFPDSEDSPTHTNTSAPSAMASNRYSYQPSTLTDQSAPKTNPWRSSVSAPPCGLCNKAVFPAEEVNGAGQKYHKLCLKCTACNTLLNSGNLNEHERKIYCVPCYRRQFGPRGVGRGLANSFSPAIETPPSSPSSTREDRGLSNSDWNGYQPDTSTGSSPSHASSDDDWRQSRSNAKSTSFPTAAAARQTLPTATPSSNSITSGSAFKMMSISGNVCPRCSKTVYSAEEVKAIGKSFHKRCYTCAHCKGSINAGRYSEHEGEIYDNNCYQRMFGPRGVGFGMGSGVLSTAK